MSALSAVPSTEISSTSTSTSTISPPGRPLVGVGVIITHEQHPGCILIGLRLGSHGSGTWALPGGHLEYGESWESCGIREVEEETGLKISSSHFAHLTNDLFPTIQRHYITIFLQSHVHDNQSPVIMEPHKCSSWEWIPWSELHTDKWNGKLFPPLEKLVKQGYNPFEKERPKYIIDPKHV